MAKRNVVAADDLSPGWLVSAACECQLAYVAHEQADIDGIKCVLLRITKPCLIRRTGPRGRLTTCFFSAEERVGARNVRSDPAHPFFYDPLAVELSVRFGS